MFTGLVETVGSVVERQDAAHSTRMRIEAPLVCEDLSVGDSVSVNGACLTVEECDAQGFSVTAIPETLQRTSLGDLAVDSSVNLERAMPATGRFGGHIVQGHVDTTGVISAHVIDGADVRLVVSCGKEDAGLVVEKGSITLGGVSLTVAAVRIDANRPTGEQLEIEVALIPHTCEATTLGQVEIGDRINVEFDVLAKYTERLLAYPRQPMVTV